MSLIEEERLRLIVVNSAKNIYQKGLVQAGEGNISLRLENKNEMLITPTFNTYEELEKADIVRMKLNGTLISSSRKPSSEYRLHSDVYRARPRVKAVIHTHSPYATIMSAARIKIPVLIEEQVIFLGGFVNVSEFASAHTHEFSENVIKALGSRNGILMANHGCIVCGRSMKHAIKMAELVEKLAMIHYGATQMGGTVSISEKSCPMFIDDFEENFATHTNKAPACEEK
ncbi:MAG: class II aldolase/adducin family protein [Candidatus Lokiarchaeota archaeon]|nr:class II aldolase/adducin family protein [Candidatus Lokiarchaeota archaeon]MBD3201504.1 class II aldolase/adducin family protein [Candidatus Lokiarchaeota archaeon]